MAPRAAPRGADSIRNVDAFLVDLEPDRVRLDAIQSFARQETIFVEIENGDGETGLGYAYTIGSGGRAVLAHLRNDLIPMLSGADASRIEEIWHQLHWANHGTVVGPITNLALAAVDTALWDLRGKVLRMPLWRLAGGARPSVPMYDTEGGWLHLSIDELAEGAREAMRQGWPAIKIKIGKPRVEDDLERLQAVRDTVGTGLDIMVDANQSMTHAEAIRRAHLFEPLQLSWLEEPLPADDISGHARLAASTSIPIAVGESIYSLSHFREYLVAGAAGVLQPDVARIGGITPWLKVAHLAEAFNVKVSPHFLMELHVSLASAVPNAMFIEHIPQLRDITRTEMQIVDGRALAPDVPGNGIDWDIEKIKRLRIG